jgi:hypothetical protein
VLLSRMGLPFRFSRLLALARYNLLCIGRLPVLCAFAYGALIPFVFGLSRTSDMEMAQIGEMYLSLTGAIILPHLTIAEQETAVRDSLFSKQTPYWRMALLRLFLGVTLLLLVIGMTLLIVLASGGAFAWLEIGAGVAVTALMLGACGLIVATLSGSLSAAYITVFVYYGMELLTKGRYTGDMYLFSLTRGGLEQGKGMLAAAALLLMALTILWLRRKSG